MDTVFNINFLALEGLGATLTSLIRNCSQPQELKLWFLCSKLEEADKINISNLLTDENFTGYRQYIDFDDQKIFGHLRSLHGDWTTYGRLLIANYLKSDTALYLDADLIISLDVLNLKNVDLGNNLLGAVYASTISWALDNRFFTERLNWPSDRPCFNAGILIFNLKKWREENVDQRWKYLAEKYPNDLISHDQTLLNALCEGKFAYLAAKFNNPWYPGSEKPDEAEDSIIHFVGSPKPWDIFGKFIHGGHAMWATYTNRAWRNQYSKMDISKIRRAWKIKKSILRHAKNSFYKK